LRNFKKDLKSKFRLEIDQSRSQNIKIVVQIVIFITFLPHFKKKTLGGIGTPMGGIATPIGGIGTPMGGIGTPVGGIQTPMGGIGLKKLIQSAIFN